MGGGGGGGASYFLKKHTINNNYHFQNLCTATLKNIDFFDLEECHFYTCLFTWPAATQESKTIHTKKDNKLQYTLSSCCLYITVMSNVDNCRLNRFTVYLLHLRHLRQNIGCSSFLFTWHGWTCLPSSSDHQFLLNKNFKNCFSKKLE